MSKSQHPTAQKKTTKPARQKLAALSVLGQKLTRNDGEAKVTGQAAYVDDLRFPNMLHAAVATSAVPHAFLDGVDTRAARQAPGVRAVMIASHVPGENQIGVAASDQPLLAEGKVRWRGDRLAIVAAESPLLARRAAALVKGVYRELPGVFSIEEAIEKEAPLLHDENPTGNIAAKGCVYKGDAKKEMKGAEIVVEGTFHFTPQEHAYLEPQGALAVPQSDGSMTVYGTMQCPFYVQSAVAGVLGLPLSKVRVVQTATGGAFGGKEDYPSEPAACAALLAHRTGRPVKLIFNREEDVLWSTKREGQLVKHRLGAKADGTLVAMEIDVYLDSGAYAGLGAVVADRANASAAGPYRVPHVRVDTYTVYTCNAFSGAYRGFGHPQVAVACEMQMDELARRVGLSPVEIRRKNPLRVGDVNATGEKMGAPVEALETLEKAVSAMDFAGVRARVLAHNKRQGRTRMGLGISTISYGSCLHAGGQFLEGAGALVQIHRDGSVSASVGNTEMGQGATTVLAGIVAEALGCGFERVTFKTVDTDLVPDSGPTVASRTTTMSGNALLDACRQLQEELRPVAAGLLKVKESAVTFEKGVVKAGRKKRTLDEVVAEAYMQKRHLLKAGWYAPPRKAWNTKTGQGQPYSAYAYATQIALVEVDTLTGRTRVKKVTAAHDVGRALFVDGIAGQVEGGITQGMGYAMMERLVQEKGVIKNANFTDYLIPSILDAPLVDVVMLEAGGVAPDQAAGPYGAKGVGEPSLIPICAAVGNAITDAVGTRITQMPFMPELVLDALAQKGVPDPLALLPIN
jgi:CO/xanthine dehydrogenase Mo-binding subunit